MGSDGSADLQSMPLAWSPPPPEGAAAKTAVAAAATTAAGGPDPTHLARDKGGGVPLAAASTARAANNRDVDGPGGKAGKGAAVARAVALLQQQGPTGVRQRHVGVQAVVREGKGDECEGSADEQAKAEGSSSRVSMFDLQQGAQADQGQGPQQSQQHQQDLQQAVFAQTQELATVKARLAEVSAQLQEAHAQLVAAQTHHEQQLASAASAHGVRLVEDEARRAELDVQLQGAQRRLSEAQAQAAQLSMSRDSRVAEVEQRLAEREAQLSALQSQVRTSSYFNVAYLIPGCHMIHVVVFTNKVIS